MRKSGFTLIELLISLAILLVVLAIIFTIYFLAVDIFTQEGGSSALRQEVEGAMHSMTDDFRRATEITDAADNSITVWVDADADETQDTDELITYSFSGAGGDPLVKTVNGEAKNILYGVTEFALEYDSELLDSIHLITINLSAALGDETVTLSSTIKPRNIL
ncbi:MAG: prepilin-type N-terminal cleavage/methylation domain-containing protein [Candidatus Margulisiibacteriota bacterium]